MQLTNGEILEHYVELQTFKNKDIRLPVKLSYLLIRNIKALEGYAIDIDRVRKDIIVKYGSTSDGSNYNIDKKNSEKFSDELNQLLSIENEIQLSTISEDDFVSMNIDLSSNDVEALLFLITSQEG